MVREKAGIDYNASGYKMGAGISHVYFPNGEITSVQPYISLQIPFTTLYTSGWTAGELSPETFSQSLYDRDASFALSYKHYRGGSLFDKDIQPGIGISTIGVDWRHNVSGGYYYSLSTHGAYEGEADGYAEVMGGAGSRWRLCQNTTLGLAMAIGSGGGGNVATGGGLLGAVTLNLEQKLTRQLFLSLQGGYTGAMDGGLPRDCLWNSSRHSLYDTGHHWLGERDRDPALCARPLSFAHNPAALLHRDHSPHECSNHQ